MWERISRNKPKADKPNKSWSYIKVQGFRTTFARYGSETPRFVCDVCQIIEIMKWNKVIFLFMSYHLSQCPFMAWGTAPIMTQCGKHDIGKMALRVRKKIGNTANRFHIILCKLSMRGANCIINRQWKWKH